MNERIRLLVKQAGLNDYINDNLWPAEQPYFNTLMEKFAELIVRECLDIVNRHEYSYHEADPLWETAQLIKEHFGVDL